jgi:hypothetical protein
MEWTAAVVAISAVLAFGVVWLVPLVIAAILIGGSIVSGAALAKDPSLANVTGEPLFLTKMALIGLAVALGWLATTTIVVWRAARIARR